VSTYYEAEGNMNEQLSYEEAQEEALGVREIALEIVDDELQEKFYWLTDHDNILSLGLSQLLSKFSRLRNPSSTHYEKASERYDRLAGFKGLQKFISNTR